MLEENSLNSSETQASAIVRTDLKMQVKSLHLLPHILQIKPLLGNYLAPCTIYTQSKLIPLLVLFQPITLLLFIPPFIYTFLANAATGLLLCSI